MSANVAWIVLIIAGLLETGWAIGLKYTHGFTRPVPSVVTIILIIASMLLLSWSARVLPIGTAYAVWTGIGAFGAAIIGMLKLGEPANPARLAFLGLLLIAIIGLKFTTRETSAPHPQTAVENQSPGA